MEWIDCQPLVAGEVTAPGLVLTAPLSLWGGVDLRDGSIVDGHHPQVGRSITDRVLVMSQSRGSSSASSVLAEMIRRGSGPAGIVLGRPDPILMLGVVVALELYDRRVPTVLSELTGWKRQHPTKISILEGGRRLGLDSPGPPQTCR